VLYALSSKLNPSVIVAYNTFLMVAVAHGIFGDFAREQSFHYVLATWVVLLGLVQGCKSVSALWNEEIYPNAIFSKLI
jgi:hypothetical protein